MPDVVLTQQEADALLQMEKIRTAEQAWEFPTGRGKLDIPLISRDRREQFHLDINRATIALKVTYQTRARRVFPLVRLDFGPTGRHKNPDDQFMDGPHIHLYREGYGDKWAYPVPSQFTNLKNLTLTLVSS